MRINYSLFKKFFIILFIFIQYEIYSSQTIVYKSYSDDAYVFCSTKYKNWKWLKEDGKKVKVEGTWTSVARNVPFYTSESSDSLGNGTLSTEYYILNGGEQKINEFKTKCISQFGNEYEYVQPARGLTDDWHLFGLSNGIVFAGIATEKFNRPRGWRPKCRGWCIDDESLYVEMSDLKTSYDYLNIKDYYAAITGIFITKNENLVHIFSSN